MSDKISEREIFMCMIIFYNVKRWFKKTHLLYYLLYYISNWDTQFKPQTRKDNTMPRENTLSKVSKEHTPEK